MTHHELPNLTDDGLATLEVGLWAERKYRLLGIYASLFATSMKDKWDHRCYIDLFAGPGRSLIEGTNRIVASSPTIALEVRDKFDCYIFCEQNNDYAGALQARVTRDYAGQAALVLPGDANGLVDDIIRRMPRYSRESTVLSFCFADPFAVSNLRFDTIRRLSDLLVDFLILLPTGMDASRNWKRQFIYAEEETSLDAFFGTKGWRQAWSAFSSGGKPFDAFVVDFYSERMREIGYSHGGVDSSVLIRNPDRNQRLYRLGFYSKSPLGETFWKQAVKYSSEQADLF